MVKNSNGRIKFMYCKKCGAQIDGDSVFCQKCGEKQTIISETKETYEKANDKQVNSQNIHSNMYSEKSAVFAESESKNKNLKKILITAVAFLLVVILLITGYTTSFFGLFPAFRAKAPIGLTLKSIYTMKNLSSAEFDLSVNNSGIRYSNGGSRYSASGYFVLGKDLKNSVVELNATENDTSAQIVLSQGNLGSLENGKYEYDGGIDKYVTMLYPHKASLPEGYDNPLLLEDYEKLLKYGESEINNAENADEKRNYQYRLDTWKLNAVVINDLVKNKELNTALIQKIIKVISEEETNYALKISDKAQVEAENLINDFVFTECEKEAVYEKFIYDFDKSKNGKLNRYAFSVDIPNFTVAFLEYFRSSLNDSPELEKALDNYIKSLNSERFFNTKGFIDYTIREIRNKFDEAPKISDLYVSMEIDNKNMLHSFEASLFDKYYEINSSMSLQIKNHNKVKPDSDSINSFLDEAKKCAEKQAAYEKYYKETQSMYDKYLENKVEKINNQQEYADCKATEKKVFDFDDDGVLDLYYKIQYEDKMICSTGTQEGLCTISDNKVVELFAEGEGGQIDYGENSYISTAYSKDLSKHVICVIGFRYEGAFELFHNYYSMENGKLKPLDKLLCFATYENNYLEVNGKKVDETTFFKAADKYTAPTNSDYIFTESDWEPLRKSMEESRVYQLVQSAINSTDTE